MSNSENANSRPTISRRVFLKGAAATVGTGLLAACTPGATTPGASASASSPAASASAVAQSKGVLTLGFGFGMPRLLDPLKDPMLTRMGMQEQLTVQTAQNKIQPWLAESVTNVDPTTWRVTLRPNLKFWDGSPVTAADVSAAMTKNWAASTAANGLISKNTVMTVVDDRTLLFKTPAPTGLFPGALSTQYFGIHKPGSAGGTDGTVMTGPYRPTKFTVGTELDLEAFKDYWGGVPPIAQIICKNVVDPNLLVTALQAGDLDGVYTLPPDYLKNFGSDVESYATPSGRISIVDLNVTRLPFSDPAVRQAAALGIDRNLLNLAGLGGKGAPALGLFPATSGFDVVPLQTTDPNQAKTVLDNAGWTVGANGVRSKNGKPLSFTLYTYPGRSELTPMAVAIQGQLKPLGYDIKVVEEVNVTDRLDTTNFDAVMSSVDTLRSGDPQFFENALLIKGANSNLGGYSNPQVDALLAQLGAEVDPAKRQALSRQIQEVVKTDVPALFLAATPIVTAFKKGKVQGFVPHFSDLYFISFAWRVA